MKRTRLLFLALIASSAGPATAQIQDAGERAAQARLPQGRAALWSTLRTTKIGMNEARGIFTATHSPAVRALAGKTVTLPGFINPLDTATRGNHFLLSKYTPVCAFCPPGEPNEVVEVRTSRPIAYSQKLVSITGTFQLENNGDTGLFFRLDSASVR